MWVKRVIQTIRIEAREILSLLADGRISEIATNKIRLFFSRSEVKYYSFFENKNVGNRINYWLLGNSSYPSDLHVEIEQSLMVFVTETNMLVS